MLYCDSCAKYNEWPETGFKTHGKCEICEEPGKLCNDRPSKLLPVTKWAQEKYGVDASGEATS